MRAEQKNTSFIKIVLLSFAVSTSFVCSALVSDSSAIELTQDVTLVTGNFRSQIATDVGVNNGYCIANSFPGSMSWQDQVVCNTGTIRFYSAFFSIPNRQYVAGDWIVIQAATVSGDYSHSNHFRNFGTSYGGIRPVDLVYIDEDSVSANSGIITFYFRVYNTFTDSNLKLVGSNGEYAMFDVVATGGGSDGNNNGQAVFRLTTTTVFHERSGTDYSSAISSINSNINSTNSKLDTVNRSLNDVNNNLEQANDDANDRYQDEKDTISQNGDDAVDSWQDNAENLSFDAPTFLFGWLWSLGSVEDCVDISVLASLIHSPETTYCTWYPTSIRSIISPIINLFIVCLLSGFIISWLKRGGV